MANSLSDKCQKVFIFGGRYIKVNMMYQFFYCLNYANNSLVKYSAIKNS